MLRVFIEPDPLFDKEIQYAWDLFARNKNIPYAFNGSAAGCDVSIGSGAENHLQISRTFYEKLREGKFHHAYHFPDTSSIRLSDGTEDSLSTAFYMVNAVQEINHPVKDSFGRFPYSESYQYKYNCVTENLVQGIFDRLFKRIPSLATRQPAKKKQTRIFLTHDIDTVQGSILQDTFFALKKFQFFSGVKLLLRNMQHPQWLNINEMMTFEEKHHFKSTFFWLTKKGRVNDMLSNSDYNIADQTIRQAIASVSSRGNFNGLHKSAGISGFEEEQKELDTVTASNRYHYLKFIPADDYEKIESAKLKLDSSLGFAETHGFRNSYGSPFQPFDLKERRRRHFVEVPLHVMDTTFFNYKKASAGAAYDEIVDFVSRNREDAVLTFLFHNNFISDFKYAGYKKLFLNLLSYFNRENFECITEKEIIENYLDGN